MRFASPPTIRASHPYEMHEDPPSAPRKRGDVASLPPQAEHATAGSAPSVPFVGAAKFPFYAIPKHYPFPESQLPSPLSPWIKSASPDCDAPAISDAKEEERLLPQALLLHFTLHLDTREAAQEDALEKTANYAKLSKTLLRACETSQCQLIETLAQNLARLCLDAHPAIQQVDLEIRKPAGLPHGDYAAIAISRTR